MWAVVLTRSFEKRLSKSRTLSKCFLRKVVLIFVLNADENDFLLGFTLYGENAFLTLAPSSYPKTWQVNFVVQNRDSLMFYLSRASHDRTFLCFSVSKVNFRFLPLKISAISSVDVLLRTCLCNLYKIEFEKSSRSGKLLLSGPDLLEASEHWKYILFSRWECFSCFSASCDSAPIKLVGLSVHKISTTVTSFCFIKCCFSDSENIEDSFEHIQLV